MKLNNKGFMLAEIIIVSAIIITTVVGLYKGFSNTYTAYETRNSYYDTKTTYALKIFEDFLIDEMILNNINQEYITFSKNYSSTEYQKKFMEEYFTTYSIAELYLVKYTENNLKPEGTLKNVLDDDFKNYIKFYLNQLDDSKYDSYDYIILAKTNEDKYSALRIKNISNNSGDTTQPTVDECTESTKIKYTCSSATCQLLNNNKVLKITSSGTLKINTGKNCDYSIKYSIIGGGYDGEQGGRPDSKGIYGGEGGTGGNGGKIYQGDYTIKDNTYSITIGSNNQDSDVKINSTTIIPNITQYSQAKGGSSSGKSGEDGTTITFENGNINLGQFGGGGGAGGHGQNCSQYLSTTAGTGGLGGGANGTDGCEHHSTVGVTYGKDAAENTGGGGGGGGGNVACEQRDGFGGNGGKGGSGIIFLYSSTGWELS